jgi:hypothetical protein
MWRRWAYNLHLRTILITVTVVLDTVHIMRWCCCNGCCSSCWLERMQFHTCLYAACALLLLVSNSQ